MYVNMIYLRIPVDIVFEVFLLAQYSLSDDMLVMYTHCRRETFVARLSQPRNLLGLLEVLNSYHIYI